MLPKWFTDWNRDNPVDVFGPAIKIGAIGGVLIVVVVLLSWGQPWATASVQTGPRGTGMSVTDFADAEAEMDTVALPAADPATAELPAVLATPSLAAIPADRRAELIAAMRGWTGIPDLFANEESYQTTVARRMIDMTQYLNEEWSGHVGEEAGLTCNTCHRGEPVPSHIWFDVATNESMAGWSAIQNRATPLSQSTSLPSNALAAYLVEEGEIKVHDLESRVAREPGDPSIQHAERTYALMNYFAGSLGVNCVFCHNSRAFYDVGENTPQWAVALQGIDMVREANNDFLLPLKETLPATRLGPVTADAPKAACMTCHKGERLPLGGQNVIGDWPELATTGE